MSSSLNTAEVYTFWKLIHTYKIVIPIIQRDYVQGLDNSRAIEVREKFLNQLFRSLHERQPVLLDFIYGTTDEEQYFAPLDGQQRLTTLYLLHWYVVLRENKMKEYHQIFEKFSYETRQHSKQFFEFLTTIQKIDFNKETISQQLKNEATFFERWLMDPTVQSSLVMLDAIHQKYQQPILNHLESDTIQFYFIDLDKFNLEDSLYIKMNARGKPLTIFEIFKARLQGYIQESQAIPMKQVEDFFIQIDTKWTDLLWRYAKKEYDIAFYQLIKTMLANQVASQSASTEILDVFLKKNDIALLDTDLKTAKLNASDWMQEMALFLNKFEQLISLADAQLIDVEALFQRNLSDQVTYTERIQLYSLVIYVKYAQQLQADSLNKWLRYVRNVTENTLYNNVSEYRLSIIALYNLKDYVDNIDAHLASGNMKLEGFYQSQIQQEIDKAMLKALDSNWKPLIEKVEDYPYFLGEISFLLKFSDIADNTIYRVIDHQDRQKSFLQYFEKAKRIFGEKSLKVSSTLLSRALLCIGDYLLKIGRNHTFLRDNFDRDYSWKRYLREENVCYLKEILDALDVSPVDKTLNDIIANFTGDDWRTDFILYPKIIKEYCGENRNIRKLDDGVILLLKTNATNGYCAEYRTYSLYLQSLKKFGDLNIEYIHSVGADYANKYMLINDEYGITYNAVKFVIERYNEVKQEWTLVQEIDTVAEVFNWLEKLNKQLVKV